jgi:2-iminobutanoate/2-iminopropanoate deaminase
MSGREGIRTDAAPAPAGPYSQAVRAGDFVFLAGQTPRDTGGVRHLEASTADQTRIALDNLAAVAAAAGATLADAVKVCVFVRPGVDVREVDAVYRSYVSEPYPARTTIVSDLTVGAVEIDAILWCPLER